MVDEIYIYYRIFIESIFVVFFLIIEPKTIYFNLPKKVDNNLKHQIGFIMKHNFYQNKQ